MQPSPSWLAYFALVYTVLICFGLLNFPRADRQIEISKEEACKMEWIKYFPKVKIKNTIKCSENGLFLLGDVYTKAEYLKLQTWAVDEALNGHLYLFLENAPNGSFGQILEQLRPPPDFETNASFLLKTNKAAKFILPITDFYTKALTDCIIGKLQSYGIGFDLRGHNSNSNTLFQNLVGQILDNKELRLFLGLDPSSNLNDPGVCLDVEEEIHKLLYLSNQCLSTCYFSGPPESICKYKLQKEISAVFSGSLQKWNLLYDIFGQKLIAKKFAGHKELKETLNLIFSEPEKFRAPGDYEIFRSLWIRVWMERFEYEFLRDYRYPQFAFNMKTHQKKFQRQYLPQIALMWEPDSECFDGFLKQKRYHEGRCGPTPSSRMFSKY
jgi:hypothetical protein